MARFRLAELYLNYAEALNEYESAPPQAAYDAVNTIRSRAGMPDFPANMTQEASVRSCVMSVLWS